MPLSFLICEIVCIRVKLSQVEDFMTQIRN